MFYGDQARNFSNQFVYYKMLFIYLQHLCSPYFAGFKLEQRLVGAL
jgi:hypothetical protein